MDKEAPIINPIAVIVTAIPLEFSAVKSYLNDGSQELVHPSGTVYEKGSFQGTYHTWEVGIAEVGAGNNTCALETERAINYFKPQVIIFVGIAGGIKDLELGDVVVADKAYGYERGKVTSSGFFSRPDVGKSSYALLQRAKAEARNENWKTRIKNKDKCPKLKVIIKPIAAGEKVITEVRSEVVELIKTHYNDAVAIEMEGCGFYTACNANEGKHFLIVRGISDLLANKSETDSLGFQDIAAINAGAFAFEVLSKFKIN